MKRLVPFPLLATSLFAMWVLLTGSSPGAIVLGAALALLVSRIMLLLAPEPVRLRFGPAMVKLAVLVAIDIVRSNVAVGKIVLTRPPGRRAGFIRLPTDLRNPYALATLAIIVSATPGTLWVQHDARRHTVLIHVLDLIDEDEWIALLKNRYERLLMEIFI